MINYVNEQYQIIKLAFLIKVKVNKMMCINCEERIALLSKKNITQVNKSRVDLTFEIKKRQRARMCGKSPNCSEI